MKKKIIIALLALFLINLSAPAQAGRSKVAVERAKESADRSKTVAGLIFSWAMGWIR